MNDKNSSFFPTGLEKGKQRLPIGTNFGKIKADAVLVYGKSELMFSNVDEHPTLFVDLEAPQPHFKVMKHKQVHIGCIANFDIMNKGGCQSDPRVDIYIPLNELGKLIDILLRIKMKHTP